jgi:DNA-binding beta-propeller fold protein YncE
MKLERLEAMALRLLTALALLAVGVALAADHDDGAPRYVVDPSWPKQLPNDWIVGQIGGLAVDSHDHIWVNQRPLTLTDDELGAAPNPPTRTGPRSLCCKPAPSVMEFDREGNLLQAWGGPVDPGKCVAPACVWPANEHGIFVDDDDHVWVGGNGATDRMLLKFKADGTFELMIGGSFNGPADSSSHTHLGKPAGIALDKQTNQLFVADGYLNRRVVVFDATSGAFVRDWGAYGNPPVDLPAGQPSDPNSSSFNNPVHCVILSHDGLVYVCDRVNNRIQIFDRTGHYQKQYVYDPATLGNGSTWVARLSPDPAQKYLIYADGENNVVRIVDRQTGAVLSSFGHNGRNAGQFHWVHQLGVDSRGVIYTGEVDTSKRLQKFVPAEREGHGGNERGP